MAGLGMNARSETPRVERALALVLGLMAVVLALGTAVLDPLHLAVGSADSAARDHLWGLWVTADSLFRSGPFIRDAPDVAFPIGFYGLQYEAANLMFFLPGYALGGGDATGAVLGWNLLHAGTAAAASAGCWLLGRDLMSARPELLVLMAAFACSPFLLAHPHTGHSEYLPVALWPWHLWALFRWLRGGTWRWAVMAGLSLGGMAATASYLPVFLTFLEVPLGAVLAWRAGPRGLARLLLVATIALALAGAFGVALSQPWPRGHGALVAQMTATTVPFPSLQELMSGITRFWPGQPAMMSNEQPAYPGVVVCGLALLGAVFRKEARGWVLLGALGICLGLGVGLTHDAQRYLLPVGQLTHWLPMLGAVHFWERVAPLAALPLGIAAAYGTQVLGLRVHAPRAAAVALALAVVADQATWPRARVLPQPSFELRPPAELLEVLDELPKGALLQLPIPFVHLPGPHC